MADMQITVRFGREAHLNFVPHAFEFTRFEFFVYDLFDEI